MVNKNGTFVFRFVFLFCYHHILQSIRNHPCRNLLLIILRSYRLATVSQLTPYSYCPLSTDSHCPACNISARTAHKTPFLCCCFQFLPYKHACLQYQLLYSCFFRGRCLATGLMPQYYHPIYVFSFPHAVSPQIISTHKNYHIIYISTLVLERI
jgi:hypothetical protein